LSFLDVMGGVLEDASCPISALTWVVEEILAYRREVLPAESLLLLKFFLTMSESASLILELVLTLLALQVEPAQFSFDLSLPSRLHLTVLLG